jgi:hypothetical protein
MLKLSVSAAEKIGTDNFGSIGAQCSIELELDSQLLEHADALAEAITRHQETVTTAMRAHMKRMVATSNATPKAPPQASSLPHRPNGKPQATPPTNGANGTGKAAQADDDDGFTPEDDHDDDAPTTGRELLGWARRQAEDAFPWLVKTGKKRGFPERILDWNEDQVTQAYRAYHKVHTD